MSWTRAVRVAPCPLRLATSAMQARVGHEEGCTCLQDYKQFFSSKRLKTPPSSVSARIPDLFVITFRARRRGSCPGKGSTAFWPDVVAAHGCDRSFAGRMNINTVESGRVLWTLSIQPDSALFQAYRTIYDYTIRTVCFLLCCCSCCCLVFFLC